MARRPAFPIAIAVLAAALTLTAADQSWLAETWYLPKAAQRSYSKVLVVGISDDAKARRNFENKFVSHLRGRGIECITGYSIAPDLSTIDDPTGIVDALLLEKVDAVITVSLIAEDAAGEPGDGVWTRELESEVQVRQYIESALGQHPDGKRLVADVGLWDMVTRGRVWAARTHPNKLAKLRKSAGEIVDAVIYRLKYDGRL